MKMLKKVVVTSVLVVPMLLNTEVGGTKDF
jgi:hypothetical protein